MASDPVTSLQLLVCDVDGTVVRSDKSLSQAVVDAVMRLQATGVTISLISARPPSGMMWIAERLGLSSPMGAFNGGTIVRPDGTIISAARVGPEVARHALALIDRPNVVKWLFFEGRWHADRLHGLHEDAGFKAANQEPVVGSDFGNLLGAVDKIVAVSDDHAMLAALETQVAAALGPQATVGRSQTYYLDITAPAANKGDGILALAAATRASLEFTAAIGDQRNDMAMFQRAGISIAMAQAPGEVRAAAMRVTGSNDEDGVAQAIDTILLPIVMVS